ncbi:hypothetical protein PG995_005505 [Apiospora arundinis]
MERLPLEPTQRIFSQLDLPSLRNAAISCPAFFNSFKSAESLILDAGNQFDIGRAIKFSQRHLKTRTLIPSQWELVDAWAVERFHHFVDYFATRYATEALANQPCFRGDQMMFEGRRFLLPYNEINPFAGLLRDVV